MKFKDFAAIRRLADRQVLAFTESTNDGFKLSIMFKYKGAGATLNIGFESEVKLNKAFNNFIKGKMDELILDQIENISKTFVVVEQVNV